MENNGVILITKESEYQLFQAAQFNLKRIYTLTEDALVNTSLCVIISPVTSEEAARVKAMSNVTFFVYLGVQKLKEPMAHIHHFAAVEALKTMLAAHETQRVMALKLRYLEQAIVFNESDQLYIDRQYGLLKFSTREKKAKKHLHVFKRRAAKRQSSCSVGLIGSTEKAAAIAKAYQKMSSDHCLLIDGDLLNPALDDVFKISHIETTLKTQLTGRDNTALNVLVDARQKGLAVERIAPLVVHSYSEHLDLMFGNYNPHNYEHYRIEDIVEMLEALKRIYDVLFICLPQNLYDELTLAMQHFCEMNVFLTSADKSNVRTMLNSVALLENRRGLSPDRFFFHFSKGAKGRAVNSDVLRALFKKQYLATRRSVLKQLLKGRW